MGIRVLIQTPLNEQPRCGATPRHARKGRLVAGTKVTYDGLAEWYRGTGGREESPNLIEAKRRPEK